MSTLAIVLLSCFVLIAALSIALFLCIFNNNKHLETSAAGDSVHGTDERRRELGSDKLSLEAYYRPMRQMLDPVELQRARSMEGISPAQWKEFRAQRLRAFRIYLGDLKVDFRRLEFKLRYMALAARAEDADYVIRLNKLKAQFGIGMIVLELRLLAFQLGFGSIEVSPLLNGIAQLEKALEPQPALAAAASA